MSINKLTSLTGVRVYNKNSKIIKLLTVVMQKSFFFSVFPLHFQKLRLTLSSSVTTRYDLRRVLIN